MAQSMRFGRKSGLSSTLQLIHDVRVFTAEENARRIGAAIDPGKAEAPAAPDRLEVDGPVVL